MNTVRLIQAYSGGAAGLAFRLRQQSANEALGRRIQEQQQNGGPPPNGAPRPSR